MSIRKKKFDKSILIKYGLISVAIIYLALILVIPVISVFIRAFESGMDAYVKAIVDPFTVSAIKLTLLAVVVCVPINTVFGVVAAWAIAKFKFRGRNLIISFIDLPFSISPIIAGLMFVLIFSTTHGALADFLVANDIKIIFAPPGIIIATLFVTMPFVAKELIPIMESLGNSEEEAAITLGANGWQTFWKVTFPNIKWAIFYGVILTTARAAGEFGAVAVVSGHIRGYTNTLPLHIETLYNEYQFNAAFSVASILTVIALLNLVIKNLIKWKASKLDTSIE